MNPKTILGRYLTKQIVMSFLSVLLMILGIIFMFEIVELLRKFSGRSDVGFGLILKMGLTKLPRTMDMILPFVMMIAAMITFWRLSKTNEFVIVRASGVSIWGFLLPVLVATFAIGVVNIAIVNPISSYLYEKHETYEYRLKTKNPNAVLFTDRGLWIRESDGQNGFVVMQSKSARQEDDKLLLRDVSILEMDKNTQVKRRIEAYLAVLNSDRFELKDVKIFKAGEQRQTLSSMDYKTMMTIERIKENFIDPEAISFWKLPSTIRFYELSGFAVTKHYMRYLSLLVSPFLLCSMVLVAAVFALRPNTRKGGVLLMIIGGVSVGFVVYFFSQVIYAFGMNNYIPSAMAAWTPTLVVAMFSVSVLLHLEDG